MATPYNARRYPGTQLAVISGVTLFSLGYFWYLRERHFRRHPTAKPRSVIIEELHTKHHYPGNSMKQDYASFDYSHLSQVGLRTIEDREPMEEEELEEREESFQAIKEEIEFAKNEDVPLPFVWFAKMVKEREP